MERPRDQARERDAEMGKRGEEEEERGGGGVTVVRDGSNLLF